VSVYISISRPDCVLNSQRKRVGIYTVITVIVTIILGLYIFLDLNIVVGFLVILFAAFIYYTKKRLVAAS